MCAQTEDRLNNELWLNHKNDFVRKTYEKCKKMIIYFQKNVDRLLTVDISNNILYSF